MLRTVVVSSATSAVLAAIIAFGVTGVFARQGDAVPAANMPLSTDFTFQGRLATEAIPPTGPFDFEFRLFDQAAAGLQVGSTIPADDLQVTNGLFSIALDFGAGAFQGSERYLEVWVKPGTGGTLEKLGTRQQLTATPYALYAKATGPHSHFGETFTGSSPSQGLVVENTAADGTGIVAIGASAILGAELDCIGSLSGAVIAGLGCADIGVWGSSQSAAGVLGTSETGNGVTGRGGEGEAGVRGYASQSSGCSSQNTLSNPLCFGLIGDATNTPNQGGIGVIGQGTNLGIWALSAGGGSGYSGLFEGKVIVRDGVGATSFPEAALYADAGGLDSSGIVGKGTKSGVRGIGPANAGGTSSAGVVGEGLYGVSGDGEAIGVAGVGETGVRGDSTTSVESTTFPHAAVVGINNGSSCSVATGSVSDFCAGVVAKATTGVASVGVYSQGGNTGLWAVGGLTGIYAQGSTWGGYFAGNVHTTGVYSASDARLKTDIEPSPAGLEEVLRLQPKSYAWKTDPNGPREFGLLAQEVEEIFPELVKDAGLNGESSLALNYTGLIPVLISAIQEQQGEIDALRGSESSTRDGEAMPGPIGILASSTTERVAWAALAASLLAAGLAGLALRSVSRQPQLASIR